MKKLYLPCLLLLMPVFALAQGRPPMFKDAWKKVPGIVSSFKLNDHVGVIQVTLTDSTFELMAVDSKMSVLWRDSLKGCGVACGKFKGNILAISDSAHSNRKGNINPYYAFLIDPASGKIILQNKIFAQKAKHEEVAIPFFAADGNDFTLAVLQADISSDWQPTYVSKIEDLTLISLNEKLEPTYLKPKFPGEDFLSLKMNNNGDLFLLTIRDLNSLRVRRYDRGSIEPSEPIMQDFDSADKEDLLAAAAGVAPSETDRNIVYLSIGHANTDQNREIITAKFNFSTHKAQVITEVFTRKHIKEIEKAYVPVNNDFPAANLGSAKAQMRVQYVAVQDGKLITAAAEIYPIATSTGPFLPGAINQTAASNDGAFSGNGLVISCYDSDLKQLFQQVMPVNYTSRFLLTTGYALGTDGLKIVSNSDDGSVFGQLDLSTGKWLRLARIDVDKKGSDQHIIWFNDTAIVPYLRPRSSANRYNIDLALVGY